MTVHMYEMKIVLEASSLHWSALPRYSYMREGCYEDTRTSMMISFVCSFINEGLLLRNFAVC